MYVAIPCVLLAMQPDYGTAMVFLVVSALMIFIAGINIWYVVGAIVTVVVSVFLAYQYVLPDYAKNRITVFLAITLFASFSASVASLNSFNFLVTSFNLFYNTLFANNWVN